MGMFDNILKQIDNGLKAVESGALDEKLQKFADTIDKTSKQADTTINKVADRPGELLKVAEQKKAELENKAKEVHGHVTKQIDIIQKKG